jgi:hypothetical protein
MADVLTWFRSLLVRELKMPPPDALELDEDREWDKLRRRATLRAVRPDEDWSAVIARAKAAAHDDHDDGEWQRAIRRAKRP